MKMRQKLVAVLAASMVVTSVPVVTMADTYNNVSANRYAKKDTTMGYYKTTVGDNSYVYIQTGTTQDRTLGYNYMASNGFEFTPKMDYAQAGTMYMSVTKDSEFDKQAVVTYVDAFNNGGVSNLYVDKEGKIQKAKTTAYNGKKLDDIIKAGVTMYVNANSTGVAAPAGNTINMNGLQVAIANALRANAGSIYSAVSDVDIAGDLAAAIVNELRAELKGKSIANLFTKEFGDVAVNDLKDKISEITDKVVNDYVKANFDENFVVTTDAALPTTDSFYLDAGTPVNPQFSNVVKEAIENFINAQVSTITISDAGIFNIKDASDREYEKTLRVDFNGKFKKDVTYKLPLTVKIGGDKVAILNIDGRDSFVSSGRYNLTQDVVSDQRLTVEADSEKIRQNEMDPIGKIKFKETTIKALTEGGKNRKIKLSLKSSSDLQFNIEKTKAEAKVTGKRGFSNIEATKPADNEYFLPNADYTTNSEKYIDQLGQALTTTANNKDRLRISYDITSRRNSYTDIDKQTLIIELPAWEDATSVGEMELSGIYVEPTDKTATLGDVVVTLEEYLSPAWSTSYTATKYVEASKDGSGKYYRNSNQQYYWFDGATYLPMNYADWTTDIVDETHTGYGKLYVLTSTSGVNSVDAATSSNLVKSTELKVGEVAEYDLKLTCKDDPMKTIKAGRSGIVNKNKVTFELEENVKDSLVDSRKIEFKLENGYIFGPADIDYTDKAANANGSITSGIYGSVNYKQKALQKFKDLIDNKTIEFKEKAEAGTDDGVKHEGVVRSSIELDIDADGRVVGFSAKYDRLKPENADKIKVTIPVATDVMTAGDKNVRVSANNVYTRSFQDKAESASCDIADVIAPIEVTFDGAKLKVGQQNQEAGKITIKETDKGMLEKGWLFLAADNQDGITFDGVPTVTVNGTDGKKLTVSNVELSKDKKMLGIEITKASSEASTIEIAGINLTADRTVPQANYDLAIWGSALTDENELGITNFTQNALYSQAYFNQVSDIYTVKDFIQMTTPAPDDLTPAPKAVTTQFVIGQKKFTVNGESQDMDIAPYIKDGLTFVPVKYLAKAFGIEGNAVQYDKATSTVTIIYGDKAIKMTNGKASMVVNGTEVAMGSKAEIGKEGRMCVPMAYIASALGVDKTWDGTTKTATFTNVK